MTGLSQLGFHDIETLDQESGFDFAGPAETPAGCDQVLQQRRFGSAGRLVFGFEGFAKEIEVGLLLGGREKDFGGEAVLERVVTDGGASFRSVGTGALECVATIRVDLKLGSHGVLS